MTRCLMILLALLTLIVVKSAAADGPAPGILVTPTEVRLSENLARAQLVVTRADSNGQINERSEDLSRGASFESSNANVVAVDLNGR